MSFSCGRHHVVPCMSNRRHSPCSLPCSYRVYCMLGDGECSEGSVWEAMAFASYYKLDNLVAIMDVNRLGQSEAAPLQHDMETYRKRCEAFGYVQTSPCDPFFLSFGHMITSRRFFFF